MSDNMDLQTLKEVATIVSFVKYIIVEYINDNLKDYDIECNDSEVLDYVIDKFQEILFE